MKYFRLFSDIHLDRHANLHYKKIRACPDGTDLSEFFWQPIELDTDSETTLLISGDLWTGDRSIKFANWSWLGTMCDRFKHVVICLGNHDYWDVHLTGILKKFLEFSKIRPNFHLLQNSSVEIDGVRLLGATMWTDMFDDRDAMLRAPSMMNDFNYIRAGLTSLNTQQYSKFSVSDWLSEFRKSRDYIFGELDKSDLPTIIMTHHSPSACSYGDSPIPAAYMYDGSYKYYMSNSIEPLFDTVKNLPIAWLHGHLHNSINSKFNNGVPIFANPLGYTRWDHEFDRGVSENSHFDRVSLYEVVKNQMGWKFVRLSSGERYE